MPYPRDILVSVRAWHLCKLLCSLLFAHVHHVDYINWIFNRNLYNVNNFHQSQELSKRMKGEEPVFRCFKNMVYWRCTVLWLRLIVYSVFVYKLWKLICPNFTHWKLTRSYFIQMCNKCGIDQRSTRAAEMIYFNPVPNILKGKWNFNFRVILTPITNATCSWLVWSGCFKTRSQCIVYNALCTLFI